MCVFIKKQIQLYKICWSWDLKHKKIYIEKNWIITNNEVILNNRVL